MIKHFFKLIWNRKRSNFLMMLEIFISFLVLFAVMVTITYHISNYLKPLGFSYHDVWMLTADWKSAGRDEIKTGLQQIENLLQSSPEVESFTYSESYLFMPMATSRVNYKHDNKKVSCVDLKGGDDYPEVLDIELTEGRWFDRSDNAASYDPVVLNIHAKRELFPDGDCLGKILVSEDEEYKVIGVTGEFRNSGELSGSYNMVFRRLSIDEEASFSRLVTDPFNRILIKVKPGTDVRFEMALMDRLSRIARDWTFRIGTMGEARVSSNKQMLVLPIVLLVICGFMLVNVALGLFGVIWQNINRRRSEIGLRRAVGASSNRIYTQIIGEIMAMVTFGVVLGSFFALQFPMLNIISFIQPEIYITAFILALASIYLIAAGSALYPGWLASKIQPAVALHNE